ncbi:MAG: hypothetical protein KKA97_04340 [Actinobacteria bacterium]|nr:hypothetical protein [Actinomycetota bacterium]
MRFKDSISALAAIFTAAALLTGCSGDNVTPASSDGQVAIAEEESSSEPTEPEPETDLPSDEDLEAYFSAVSTYDVGDLQSAMELTEPGSIAEAYVGYILGSANAAIDGGLPIEGTEPDKVDGGYESCPTEVEDDCVTWADVEGRDGKVVTFTVNGEELDERLSAGSGREVAAGDLAAMTLMYAYQSVQSDALFVVAEVTSNDAPVTIATYDATYRSPTGRQSTAAQSAGPSDLAADSTATVVVAFPNAEPGGTASVSFFSEDFMTEAVAALETR